MSSEASSPPAKKKKRRIGRKLLWALVFLLIGLVWLNGPGWRWLGGIGLRKALDAADMSADFELKGTLLGGIGVEKLSLSGGVIRKLEIASAEAIYDLTGVIQGEVGGVTVNRIDAVIDLAAAPPKDPDEPDTSFDPLALGETLRKVRGILLPMKLEAANLRLQLVRGKQTLLTLDSSDLNHAPGSEEFRLELGDLAIGAGYAFDPQETVIQWTEESLSLDRFDATPRLGIRDLKIAMPVGGPLTADAVVLAEDSRVVIDGSLSSATLRLEGEPLNLQEALKNLALELPVDVTIRRLEASIDGIDQSPDRWKADVRTGLVDIRHQDWQAESITLDASKDGSTGKANWSIDALEAKLTGDAELKWRALDAGSWTDFEATAKATVQRLSPLFSKLREQLDFAPAEAPPLPESSLTLDARVDSGPGGIRTAGGNMLISADEDTPSLAAEVTWTPAGKLDGTFGTSGLRSGFSLDLDAKRYEAEATLEDFRPENLAPWAAAAGVNLPRGINASATWDGSGDFAAQPHRGSFEVSSIEWVRKDMPPLILRGTGTYAWPEMLDLTEFIAITEGQTIRAEAKLADSILKIPRIQWLEGQTELVAGRAEIPVPEGPGNARDFLAQKKPLSVFLESEWIDHARLAAWLPDQDSPLGGGSGRVHLVVSGTPAEPKIELDLALKDLQVAGQPEVPVTDATLGLESADGSLALSGEIKPAGYDPVTLSGRMPFKPGVWAEDPDSMLTEKIEARANIPRLDLATFKELIPKTEELAGRLEGFFSAGGTLGEPQFAGELRLTGGAFELADSPVPPVSDAAMLVKLEGDQVRIESLSLESAGGTLTGSGTVGLQDATNPTLGVSLTGRALPIKRDESMIIRADADLTLRGDLEQAGISGSVEIVDSIYYKDIEILPVRMPFTAPSRPNLPAFDPEEKAERLPAPIANWTLDVQVSTRDPLLIRGNFANGSAIANVRFGGTLADIQPRGSAIISEAEAKLPFSTLKVKNGALTFTPEGGLNPELNIRGTSDIGRYDVSVFFYGSVDAPKTALTSNPPLPESEIMTLLATGTTSDGLEGGQAATLKAVQLLVEEWRRGRLPFGDEVAEVLSVLNRVDIRIGEDDPLTGRRLNSATIEVTDRIVISSSIDKQSNTRVLGAFVLRFK